MWKSIKNIGSAVTNLAAITGKEATYQITKASEKSESITRIMAEKTASIRHQYEHKLAMRKAGVHVVKDVDPSSVIELPTNK